MSVGSQMKFVVFLGSTREGRLGPRVWRFVDKWFTDKMENIDLDLIDPVEYDLPLLKKAIHHYDETEQGSIPTVLSQLKKKISDADGYIMISCEYNHCIPPALANLIDHFPSSAFSYKPSGLITYSPGIYGGMRAAMQLRALTGEIGCISVSNIFGIPQVHEAIDEDGNAKNLHIEKGLEKLVSQLEWMARAMKNHRDSRGIPK